MKRVMAILAVAAVMTACGTKSTEADATTTDSTEVVVDSAAVAVDSTSIEGGDIEAAGEVE